MYNQNILQSKLIITHLVMHLPHEHLASSRRQTFAPSMG